jgi:hypothetical protein
VEVEGALQKDIDRVAVAAFLTRPVKQAANEVWRNARVIANQRCYAKRHYFKANCDCPDNCRLVTKKLALSRYTDRRAQLNHGTKRWPALENKRFCVGLAG